MLQQVLAFVERAPTARVVAHLTLLDGVAWAIAFRRVWKQMVRVTLREVPCITHTRGPPALEKDKDEPAKTLQLASPKWYVQVNTLFDNCVRLLRYSRWYWYVYCG